MGNRNGENQKLHAFFKTVRVIRSTRFSYLHYHKRFVAKLKVCISHTLYVKFLCKRVCPFQSRFSAKCNEAKAKRLKKSHGSLQSTTENNIRKGYLLSHQTGSAQLRALQVYHSARNQSRRAGCKSVDITRSSKSRSEGKGKRKLYVSKAVQIILCHLSI